VNPGLKKHVCSSYKKPKLPDASNEYGEEEPNFTSDNNIRSMVTPKIKKTGSAQRC
jgi:hypothetical protein